MKFKEFSEWCNERACDGYWDMYTAIQCSSICQEIYSYPIWKREKEFQKYVKETNLVEVINKNNKLYGIEEEYSTESEIIQENSKVSIIQRIKDWFTGHGRK